MTIPDPITRQEMFLAAAAGADVKLPPPLTREEIYLEEIANKPSGGGAVDSVNGKTGAVVLDASDVGALPESYVPAPASGDNGKTLRIEGGAWVKSTPVVVVQLTKSGNVWQSSHNLVAIADEINLKKTVIASVAGNLLSSDAEFSAGDVILQLTGQNSLARAVFSGTAQGSTKTLFVTADIHLGEPPILTQIITVNVKEIALQAPLTVTYSIAGSPSGNIYPLMASEVLTDIRDAISVRREVDALLTLEGDTLKFPLSVVGQNYISFSMVVNGLDGYPVLYQINHYYVDDSEEASGVITPLIPGTMSFDSTTGTLEIEQ